MLFDVLFYTFVLLSVAMQIRDPGDQTERNIDRDYRALINAIESKNKAPMFSERGEIQDADFDWEEQKRIATKLPELSPRTADEWAVLVEFLDDSRYSISGYEKSPQAPKNYSIGQLCKDVARAQVNGLVMKRFAKHDVEPPRVLNFPLCTKDLHTSQLALVDEAHKLVTQEKLDTDTKNKLLRALDEVRDELKDRETPQFYKFNWDNFSWLRKKQLKKE